MNDAARTLLSIALVVVLLTPLAIPLRLRSNLLACLCALGIVVGTP